MANELIHVSWRCQTNQITKTNAALLGCTLPSGSITVASHERHEVSNHSKFDAVCSRACSSKRISPKLCITEHWCEKATSNWWIPLTKGQWCGKRLHVMTSPLSLTIVFIFAPKLKLYIYAQYYPNILHEIIAIIKYIKLSTTWIDICDV